MRQQNTITFLYDRLRKRDLKVFKSILTFLEIDKVNKEPINGGFTVMQSAAMDGLHEFIDVLLQGIKYFRKSFQLVALILYK